MNELSISVGISQRGGKWYVSIVATDCEDLVYEFDDEATARAALIAARVTAGKQQAAGLVERIEERKRSL